MVGKGTNQCEFADKQFSRMKSLGCLTEILTCRGATRLFAKNRIKDRNVSFSLDAATSFSSDLNILLFHGLLTAILCGANKCIQRRNVKMRIVKRKMLKMSVFLMTRDCAFIPFFFKSQCARYFLRWWPVIERENGKYENTTPKAFSAPNRCR